jgi:hypothetical protein
MTSNRFWGGFVILSLVRGRNRGQTTYWSLQWTLRLRALCSDSVCGGICRYKLNGGVERRSCCLRERTDRFAFESLAVVYAGKVSRWNSGQTCHIFQSADRASQVANLAIDTYADLERGIGARSLFGGPRSLLQGGSLIPVWNILLRGQGRRRRGVFSPYTVTRLIVAIVSLAFVVC